MTAARLAKYVDALARIEQFGPGKAFSAKDFLDIASRTMIDVTLASLAQSGKIRRVRRGLYDMPKINPALGGELSPDIDEAALAIATLEDRAGRRVDCKSAWSLHPGAIENHVPDRRSEKRGADRTPEYPFQARSPESNGRTRR